MKKITAMLVLVTMLVCVFSAPCTAAEVTAGIYLDVAFDLETKMVSFSGAASASLGKKWATYYLLYPDKTQDDIPLDSTGNPVVSHYGQVKIGSDGTFSDSFQYMGDPGIYTLYVTSGEAVIAKVIDTSQDLKVVAHGPLVELYALATKYAAPKGEAVRDVFFEKKNELDDEMPVVSPAEISGLYEIYVDVQNGNDATGTGTFDNPYQTINEALDKHKPEAGMVLVLREGTYPISDSLNISGVNATEELPFIITNYENEKVTVAGGETIDGNAFTNITDSEVLARLNPAVADKVLVADLSDMGITDYGSITTSDSPVLFVGNSKYQIARWPNSGMTTMRMADISVADTNNGTATAISDVVTNGVIDSGSITVGVGSNCGQKRTYSKRGTAEGTTDKGAEFCVEDIRPFSWVNTGEIWMYGSFYEEWAKSTVRVTEMNPETRSIRTTAVSSWGCRYNSANKFYYYNVFEELDAPGEWFMDKETGKLYVYPVSDIKKENILYAASTDNLWNINDSKNVIINGISFEYARGKALAIGQEKYPCTNVIVQNCSFENLGAGVEILGSYSGVINSEFKNIDDDGINITGSPDSYNYNLIPHRLFAQNNKLYNTTGIYTKGVGNIISHNLVSNNVGSAIYLSASRETIAEYNEIVGGPRVTLDSGAFYVNGNQHFNRGNHIRYNYVHDIGNSSPRGLYFDDMLSENYAYGNIIDGAWMQVHNGSENTVYNNLFIGHSKYSILINANYYYTRWNIRWQNGSLQYGSVTSSLKSGSAYNDGEGNIASAYATRYPRLQEWATWMYQRIAEYEGNGVVDSSSIASPYIPNQYTQNFNLDQYLRAARDNHVENNVMIGTVAPVIGYTATRYYKYGILQWANITEEKVDGVWRTVSSNNQEFTADTNPFAGTDYGDEAVYEALGIDPIPFDKIGLIDEADYYVNEKAQAISPASTTDTTVSKTDLSLSWTAVGGAQLYTVEVATDAAFTNVIASADTRDMSYGVDASVLADDTVYYWRVITIPQAKGATGGTLTSDTFTFKTNASAKTSDSFNKFGVTDYMLTDDDGNELKAVADKFNISAYTYNLTDAEKSAMVYAACYDKDGRFISLEKAEATAAASDFSEKITLKVSAPDAVLVKLFVWSADGTMIPYTFVKTLE